MGAPVAWFDITSAHPARLVAFYRDLFDWTISDGPDTDYALVDTGGGTVYMRVEDLQVTLDRAEALGGQTLVPPTDLPDGFGRFALLTDPDGHAVGLWT
jgi:uncharacterized protein